MGLTWPLGLMTPGTSCQLVRDEHGMFRKGYWIFLVKSYIKLVYSRGYPMIGSQICVYKLVNTSLLIQLLVDTGVVTFN